MINGSLNGQSARPVHLSLKDRFEEVDDGPSLMQVAAQKAGAMAIVAAGRCWAWLKDQWEDPPEWIMDVLRICGVLLFFAVMIAVIVMTVAGVLRLAVAVLEAIWGWVS